MQTAPFLVSVGKRPWLFLRLPTGPPESLHSMAVSSDSKLGAAAVPLLGPAPGSHTPSASCCIMLVTCVAALVTLGGTYVGGARTRGAKLLHCFEGYVPHH